MNGTGTAEESHGERRSHRVSVQVFHRGVETEKTFEGGENHMEPENEPARKVILLYNPVVLVFHVGLFQGVRGLRLTAVDLVW